MKVNNDFFLDSECPRREAHNDCGPSVEPTCAEPNPIGPAVCTPGCYCTANFIRNDNGKCILQTNCWENKK